jgi:hypothetical protein
MRKFYAPHPAAVPRSTKTGGKLRGLAHESCWKLAGAISAAAAVDGNAALIDTCRRAEAAFTSMAHYLPELNGEFSFRTTRTVMCTNPRCGWHAQPQHRDRRACVDIAVRIVLCLLASSDLLPQSRMSARQLALAAALRRAAAADAQGAGAAGGGGAAEGGRGERKR